MENGEMCIYWKQEGKEERKEQSQKVCLVSERTNEVMEEKSILVILEALCLFFLCSVDTYIFEGCLVVVLDNLSTFFLLGGEESNRCSNTY